MPAATWSGLTLYPGLSLDTAGVWTLQPTAASQKYAPPAGFSAWDAPQQTTIYLTDTALSTWTVPGNWNNDDNSVECIGGGGSGTTWDNSGPGRAGEGGHYVRSNNLALIPGSVLNVKVGQGGVGLPATTLLDRLDIGVIEPRVSPAATIGGGDSWLGGTGLASVWSDIDAYKFSTTLSADQRTLTTTQGWGTVRTKTSRARGKLYIEYFKVSGDGGGSIMSGFASKEFNYSYLGAVNYSCGIYSSETYVSDGFTKLDYFRQYENVGETVALAIDFDTHNIWIALNNVWMNGGNPATGVHPMVSFDPVVVGPLFAGLSIQSSQQVWTLQSTAETQTHAPPAGFEPWDFDLSLCGAVGGAGGNPLTINVDASTPTTRNIGNFAIHQGGAGSGYTSNYGAAGGGGAAGPGGKGGRGGNPADGLIAGGGGGGAGNTGGPGTDSLPQDPNGNGSQGGIGGFAGDGTPGGLGAVETGENGQPGSRGSGGGGGVRYGWGGAGGDGVDSSWDDLYGPGGGGGGGGAYNPPSVGGMGGLYGGGSGGSGGYNVQTGNVGVSGAQGVIVIRYSPLPVELAGNTAPSIAFAGGKLNADYSVQGNLGAIVDLAGRMNYVAGVSGDLAFQVDFAGLPVSFQVDFAGRYGTTIVLAGDQIHTSYDYNGDLAPEIDFAGRMVGTFVLTGDMAAHVALGASLTASLVLQGALPTQVTFAASGLVAGPLWADTAPPAPVSWNPSELCNG